MNDDVPVEPTPIPAAWRLSEHQLAAVDAAVEEAAQALDWLLPGLGDGLRAACADVRPHIEQRICDCRALTGYHDWNCPATPIWAHTIRDLGINPWTAFLSPARIQRDLRDIERLRIPDAQTHQRRAEEP